jgi:hypothetical protein
MAGDVGRARLLPVALPSKYAAYRFSPDRAFKSRGPDAARGSWSAAPVGVVEHLLPVPFYVDAAAEAPSSLIVDERQRLLCARIVPPPVFQHVARGAVEDRRLKYPILSDRRAAVVAFARSIVISRGHRAVPDWVSAASAQANGGPLKVV